MIDTYSAMNYCDRRDPLHLLLINDPRMMNGLLYREREIIKLRYGVNEDLSFYTEEEVGHIFKVSRERIRSIEKKALNKLDRYLSKQKNVVE